MSFLWGPTWRETVRLDICKVAMPMTRWWAGKRQAVGSFHELSQSSQKKFNSRKWNNADFRSFGSEKMLWKTISFSHDFRKSCLLCMILCMIWRIRIGPALASMFFYPLTSGRFTNTQWRLRLGTLGCLGWVKSVNSFVAKECTIFCFWCQVSCERNPKTSSFQHVLKMFASCLIRLFQVGPSLHGSLAVGTTCCFINHCWIGSSSRWMNRKTLTSGRSQTVLLELFDLCQQWFDPILYYGFACPHGEIAGYRLQAQGFPDREIDAICEMKLWMSNFAKYIFVVSRCRGYVKEKSPTTNYAWHIFHTSGRHQETFRMVSVTKSFKTWSTGPQVRIKSLSTRQTGDLATAPARWLSNLFLDSFGCRGCLVDMNWCCSIFPTLFVGESWWQIVEFLESPLSHLVETPASQGVHWLWIYTFLAALGWGGKDRIHRHRLHVNTFMGMKHDQVLHKRVVCVYRSDFSSPHVADRGGCLRWALDARRPWHDSGARHVPGPWEWAATGTHPWLLSQWLLLNIVGPLAVSIPKDIAGLSCGFVIEDEKRMIRTAVPCFLGQSLRGPKNSSPGQSTAWTLRNILEGRFYLMQGKEWKTLWYINDT